MFHFHRLAFASFSPHFHPRCCPPPPIFRSGRAGAEQPTIILPFLARPPLDGVDGLFRRCGAGGGGGGGGLYR